MGQRVDGAVQSLLRELLGLTWARPEAGTPEQPLGLCGAESALVDGDFAYGRQRLDPLSASAVLGRHKSP
jgi:hypothetical protein